MTAPGLVLRKIHLHAKFAFEIKEQLDRIPRQIKAQKTRAERLEKEFKEAQDNLKKIKVAIHEKEVTLKEQNAQLVKFQRQQNEAADTKAYEALQHEIAFTKESIAKTEEEGLNGLMLQEEKTIALPLLEKTLKEAKAESANIEKVSLERKVQLEEQLGQALQGQAEAEKMLAGEFLEKYQRIARERRHDALSPMRGKSCSACSTAVTSQMKIEVESLGFVLCQACNRALYLAEAEERELSEEDS